MRRRLLWLGLVSAALVGVVSVLLMLRVEKPAPRVTADSFRGLYIGMSEEDFKAILGEPWLDFPKGEGGDDLLIWRASRESEEGAYVAFRNTGSGRRIAAYGYYMVDEIQERVQLRKGHLLERLCRLLPW